MLKVPALAGVPRPILASLVLGIALGGLVFAYGQRQIISYETVAWGGYASGYPQAASFVINDQTTWLSVWTQAFCNSPNPCPSPPSVNFSSTTVLAVFSGVKPTVGYATNVTLVTRVGLSVLVDIKVTVPGSSCFEAAMPTYPFHIVAISKTEARVVFATKTFVKNC